MFWFIGLPMPVIPHPSLPRSAFPCDPLPLTTRPRPHRRRKARSARSPRVHAAEKETAPVIQPRSRDSSARLPIVAHPELAVTPAAPTRPRFAWRGHLRRQRQHRRRVSTLRVGYSPLHHRRVFVSPPSIRLLLLRLGRHDNLARVSCSPASCRLQSCPEGAIGAWFMRSWEHRSFRVRS